MGMPNQKTGKLGIWMATALVMGNMIGSGIFLLPASLAPFGGISILGWLFTTAGAMAIAVVFAEQSKVIPEAGGPYAYTRAGFGEFAAFLVAWGYWISIWIGNAAIAVAMVGYLGVFWAPLAENDILAAGTAVGTIWILTFVNARGVRSAGMLQLLTTGLKILPLLLIGLIGLLFLESSHFQPFNASGGSPFSAITSSATLTLWALLGLESASIPADNIENPEKTIPRATILGTGLTACIYILGTTGVMGILPPTMLADSSAPFADAASAIFGGWAGYAVAAGAAIACFGALNGWILLQGQLPRAAAKDGLFPARFATLSRQQVPLFGLIVSSILSTLLLMANSARGVVDLFTFAILLATLNCLVPYLFGTMAHFFLPHGKTTEKAKTVRVRVLAALGFAYSLWAVSGGGHEAVYWGFISLMAGVPVYVWVKNRPPREPS